MSKDNMGAKNLSVSLIANLFAHVVSIVISFWLTPYIVNNLGAELYGFYSLANSVVSYITVIATALNSMASKYIAVELVRGNERKAKTYFSSIFFSNVILSLALIPILAIIVLKVYVIFNVSNQYLFSVQVLFTLVFGAMIIRYVSSVYGCSTYVKNRTDISAYVSLAKSILRVLLYVIIFTLFKPSIIQMGAVLCIMEIFNSVIQISISKKLIPGFNVSRDLFDARLVVKTLKVGVWNSVNQIGDLLLSSSDMMVGNILLGETAAGNLSITKTMPTLLSGVITTINGVFMPRVANKYAKGNTDELVKEVNQAQSIMGTIVTPIIMILIIFNREFYSLWVPGTDTDLLCKLSLIDISRMLVIGCVWPVANLNIVMDRVKIPSLLVILAGVTNIGSMVVLINYTPIGIYAVPLTTLVLTVLFYGVFIPIYPCKKMKIAITSFFKPVLKMLIASLVIYIVIAPIHSVLNANTWIKFIIFGGTCGVLALLISALIFAGPKNIKYIINKLKNRG